MNPLYSACIRNIRSYTTFEYGEAKAEKASMAKDGQMTFTVDVRNTGDREGAEVVQLYIADPVAGIDRPSKELKGFEKITLKPGETKTVSFTIEADDLSYYSIEQNGWVADAGEFQALIGPSSADIRTSASFELK